ncbi:XRE family transcriptional regulator [Segetibacter sp. 3557_3]|uniref:helix-turn-helix domain-containing protein n=1 Tax=Segetibacter sp. 3557_3 TaxID=2547429 RepID=UPI00105901C6|nr:helix-turn-helix transcriptional regulator [Segetibacter sp. 3557_3]TDH26776.1 XRE family transcriptional regulator [Segetibacter sp. 3557_3]
MTTTPTPGKVHHGRNIKRLREMLGIKQEALAYTLGEDWSQHKVSRLEDKEVIEDEILQEVGKALHVSPEAIKNFDEEKVVNVISSTFNDYASVFNSHCTFNINPIEKWMEALEENKKLYERLLQSEKEKREMLERILADRK